MKRQIAFAVACVASLGASAACYTVFEGGGKVVYQSEKAPVNLVYPLHETVPARFGQGATLVFTSEFGLCTPIGAGEERVKVGSDDVLSTMTNLKNFGGIDPSDRAASYGSKGSDGGYFGRSYPQNTTR